MSISMTANTYPRNEMGGFNTYPGNEMGWFMFLDARGKKITLRKHLT